VRLRDVVVTAAAEPAAVFGYLADPANRPEWQASLKAVDLLTSGPPRVGTRWRDRTAVGIAPEMTITVLEEPHRWSEVGTWHGIEAVLDLELRPVPEGTEVTARFGLRGRGGWAVPAEVVGALAVPAVRADLRRAARIVERS
jgi:hypothetical protein